MNAYAEARGVSDFQREHTPNVGVRWHPAADIFPWIEGKAFDDLVEDIRKNGVLEPIVFLNGSILDGRNRYMAARQLGIEYPRIEFDGDDPLAFVIARNLHRRHLTESQRSMVGAKLAKMPAQRPSEDNSANLRTSDAAAMLNVSERSIETARQVEKSGTPELVAAVEAGKVSVSAAAIVAAQPPEVQREVVAQPNVKKAVSDLRTQVMEAAKQGSKPAPSSNKNPRYVAPSRAAEAWTHLYGTCRALTEWASDDNVALAAVGLSERADDQALNLAAVKDCHAALTRFLESQHAE
ncbi:hypothetical protein NGM99_13915 [Mesorhizobium sp. RP14(2022)]|uniref:ParB/Sulfiredoxin domain-containing protein n=1 Tax=Mesorhizobium liriopis TaxID=2953882 RepID=A0ABT1C7S3_9HYPH|nr:ParB N-terminal domain-containing protein [Mesorhizobium liriopis]MCO6050876.1 hypothetical protein [Mesorhizobium liriopis]